MFNMGKVKGVAVKAQVPRGSTMVPPRLRFDKVVLRVFSDLRTALNGEVPGGVTVVITLTAPIRLASKTTAAIETNVREMLGKRGAGSTRAKTIEGNEVRIEVIRGAKTATSPLVGFVHNRDSDPTILFSLTRALLRCAATSRVLRVEIADESRWIKTYEQVCAELFAQHVTVVESITR
jgi:hypothetical protein